MTTVSGVPAAVVVAAAAAEGFVTEVRRRALVSDVAAASEAEQAVGKASREAAVVVGSGEDKTAAEA